MKRYAVIDLGTNTFHLLIAGVRPGSSFSEIYRERIFVKLGQEGLDNLSHAAIKRSMDAMRKFRQTIDLFEVAEIKAFATAAFRSAANAEILIRRIYRELNIEVDIISGEEEARLIFEGVREGGAIQRGDNLIMDIGGGSVEFIIGNQSAIQWCTSLPIGVSVLKKKFHNNEPISKMDELATRRFIRSSISPLLKELEGRQLNTLIGSSGTFDVLAEAIEVKERIGICSVLYVESCRKFINEILALDLDQRLQHPKIPASRADLIVVALILLDEIIRINPEFRFILVSPYALKEGMIARMVRNITP